MAKPAPSHAEPIPLAATRSPREMRNALIRGILELNLMPFVPDPIFPLLGGKAGGPHPPLLRASWTPCAAYRKPKLAGATVRPPL